MGYEVDVVVYEKSYWQYMIQEHIIWVLVFSYIPEDKVKNLKNGLTKAGLQTHNKF